jgi:hypothetical protein
MESGKSKNVKCLTLNESWLYEFEALIFIFTRHGSYIPLSINHHLCFSSLGFSNAKYIYIYISWEKIHLYT